MATESAPTKRMLTPRGRATRERIVAVAAELMLEHGVAGTGVDDVQAAAHVSASQLYHYFGDKRNLVRAVVDYQNDFVLAQQEPLLSSLDSMEALRAWRDLLVAAAEETGCRGGCAIGTLSGELAEAHPDCREALADGYRRWESAIRSGLRKMQERGELRRGADPDRLALALLTAVQGGATIAQVRRDTEPLKAGIDTVLEHIESLRPRRRG